MCLPVGFKNKGDINLNQRIEMIEAGSDTCRSVTTGATAPSQALLLPGESMAQFTREVRAGKDVFVQIRPGHRFPEGGPVYVGDASKGARASPRTSSRTNQRAPWIARIAARPIMPTMST